MSIIGVIASSTRSVPNAPTIGTATDVGTGRAYNNGAATVTFTAPTYDGKLPITSYTATSSPGGFTASGASSPLTVTGLASNTAYTFTVTATNAVGTSAASSASNSITATTVPQAPTIGTASDGGTGTTVSVTFTGNATGGKAISTYTATSSPGSITGTSATSPITVSGLTTGQAYTFTVTATNANGTSAASSASNSVTPAAPGSFEPIASLAPNGVTRTTFSNITQTYKHLELHIGYIDTGATENTMPLQFLSLELNGTNTSIYYANSGYITGNTGGNGAYTKSYQGAANAMRFLGSWKSYNGTNSNTSTFAVTKIIINDYTNASNGKEFIAYSIKPSSALADTNFGFAIAQGVFSTTGALVDLAIKTTGTFNSPSWVNLYGIKE